MHRLCEAATMMYKSLLKFNTSEAMLGINTSSRWQPQPKDIPANTNDSVIVASVARHYPAPFVDAALPNMAWASSYHSEFSKAHPSPPRAHLFNPLLANFTRAIRKRKRKQKRTTREQTTHAKTISGVQARYLQGLLLWWPYSFRWLQRVYMC